MEAGKPGGGGRRHRDGRGYAALGSTGPARPTGEHPQGTPIHEPGPGRKLQTTLFCDGRDFSSEALIRGFNKTPTGSDCPPKRYGGISALATLGMASTRSPTWMRAVATDRRDPQRRRRKGSKRWTRSRNRLTAGPRSTAHPAAHPRRLIWTRPRQRQASGWPRPGPTNRSRPTRRPRLSGRPKSPQARPTWMALSRLRNPPHPRRDGPRAAPRPQTFRPKRGKRHPFPPGAPGCRLRISREIRRPQDFIGAQRVSLRSGRVRRTGRISKRISKTRWRTFGATAPLQPSPRRRRRQRPRRRTAEMQTPTSSNSPGRRSATPGRVACRTATPSRSCRS